MNLLYMGTVQRTDCDFAAERNLRHYERGWFNMALINCPECGKEISDKATTCPNCGCPVTKETDKSNIKQVGHLSYIRIALSVLLIISAVFVVYQSFFAGLSNAINATGNLDGTWGLIFALLEILFGIMGIVTAKTENYKPIRILSTLMMMTGFLYAWLYHGFYGDLRIWAWLLAIVGLAFGVSADRLYKAEHGIKKKELCFSTPANLFEKTGNDNTGRSGLSQGENIAYRVILTLFIIMVAAIIFMVFYRTVANPV